MIPAAQVKQIADQQHKITFTEFEQELVVFLDEIVYGAAKRGEYNATINLNADTKLILERLRTQHKTKLFDYEIQNLTTSQVLDMINPMCHDAGYKTENPHPGFLLISWGAPNKGIKV